MDAGTGKVLAQKREGPKGQAAEAAADAAAAQGEINFYRRSGVPAAPRCALAPACAAPGLLLAVARAAGGIALADGHKEV